MTQISATIVADSLTPYGDRITTMLVTFPRIILAEVNTHRMLSKNTSSSRAIPFKKMVEAVQSDPFIPIAWQILSFLKITLMQVLLYLVCKCHI